MRYILLMVLMLFPLSLTAHSTVEFLDLVQKTKESVVFVLNIPKEGAVITTPFKKKVEPEPEDDDESDRKRVHSGTGFYTENGYIITNWHVIQNSETVQVYFEHNPVPYSVEVIAYDKAIDIAVLKPGPSFPKNVPPLQWREKILRQGEDVWVIGHPHGFRYSVSKGVISHLDRRLDNPWQPTVQTDAAINQGNSGGPLLDMDGKVVGVNVMLFSNTGTFSGLAFAIESKIAQYTIARLLEEGEIIRPLMGVLLKYDSDLYKVVAAGVGEGGAAETAGILEGDVYLEIDGMPILIIDDVFDVLATKNPDDFITVKVLRGGDVKFIKVKLGRVD